VSSRARQEFIDAQWPSIMLSAALCDTQRFKPGETLMIGRCGWGKTKVSNTSHQHPISFESGCAYVVP